jgi:hypothetical protein
MKWDKNTILGVIGVSLGIACIPAIFYIREFVIPACLKDYPYNLWFGILACLYRGDWSP